MPESKYLGILQHVLKAWPDFLEISGTFDKRFEHLDESKKRQKWRNLYAVMRTERCISVFYVASAKFESIYDSAANRVHSRYDRRG